MISLWLLLLLFVAFFDICCFLFLFVAICCYLLLFVVVAFATAVTTCLIVGSIVIVVVGKYHENLKI